MCASLTIFFWIFLQFVKLFKKFGNFTANFDQKRGYWVLSCEKEGHSVTNWCRKGGLCTWCILANKIVPSPITDPGLLTLSTQQNSYSISYYTALWLPSDNVVTVAFSPCQVQSDNTKQWWLHRYWVLVGSHHVVTVQHSDRWKRSFAVY